MKKNEMIKLFSAKCRDWVDSEECWCCKYKSFRTIIYCFLDYARRKGFKLKNEKND